MALAFAWMQTLLTLSCALLIDGETDIATVQRLASRLSFLGDRVHAFTARQLPPQDEAGPGGPTEHVSQWSAKGRWSGADWLEQRGAKARAGGLLGRRMCIVSSANNHCAALANVTFPNKWAYAQRWGYQARFAGPGLPAPPCKRCANPHFVKFALLLEQLDRTGEDRCDWIFWSDGDAGFNNFDLPLEAFTHGEDADLIFSWYEDDVRGLVKYAARIEQGGEPELMAQKQDRRHHQLNSGHFFVRNTPWARAFVEEAESITQREHYTYWNDQGNIADLLMRRPLRGLAQHLRFYNVRAFNSAWPAVWDTSDFVIHAFGACRRKNAAEHMRDALDAAESDGRHWAEWPANLPPVHEWRLQKLASAPGYDAMASSSSCAPGWAGDFCDEELKAAPALSSSARWREGR